jgi:acid phosphatase family membrane protein YuiD
MPAVAAGTYFSRQIGRQGRSELAGVFAVVVLYDAQVSKREGMGARAVRLSEITSANNNGGPADVDRQ